MGVVCVGARRVATGATGQRSRPFRSTDGWGRLAGPMPWPAINGLVVELSEVITPVLGSALNSIFWPFLMPSFPSAVIGLEFSDRRITRIESLRDYMLRRHPVRSRLIGQSEV